MNELETNLVREYVHYTYLVKLTIEELLILQDPKAPSRGLRTSMFNMMGGFLNQRLDAAKKEMRNLGLHIVRIEDLETSPLVYIHTSYKGIKETFPIKRKVLMEDLEDRIEKISLEVRKNPMEHVQYQVVLPAIK